MTPAPFLRPNYTRPLFSIPAILVLSFVLCGPLLADPSGSIKSGDLEVSYAQTTGLTLSYRGIPISRHSSLYIVNPAWTEVYFNQERTRASVITGSTLAGAQMAIQITNDAFRADYQVSLTPETCAVTLAGTLLKPLQDARMEYAAAYLSAGPIAGSPFTAETTAGAASGTVPFAAASPDEDQSRLTAPFNSLTFQSRVGPVRLDVSGDRGPFVIFDARKNTQAWAKASPIFWIGMFSGDPLPTSRTFTTTLTYTFSGLPASQAPVASITTHPGAVRPIRTAVEPYTPPPVLIPKPRFSQIYPERFRLDPSIRIIAGPGEGDRRAAASLQSDLERHFSERLPIVPSSDRINLRRAIIIGTAAAPWGQAVAAAGAVNPPPHPDAYAIRMDPDQIWLCGRDSAGTYYAAQTLEELAGADSQGVYFQRALVADYPFQSFRGAHLFPSHEGLAFQQRLVQNVLAHFKLNRLLLESEYTHWDSHPELALPWSPLKSDVAAEIATARSGFMEPIPEIQTLGHVEWMFQSGHHDDLKEDPTSDFCYDPTNPATYALVFDVLREALRLFQPRAFHIGHDEVTDRGDFPGRSAGPGRTATSLFVDDTNRIVDFLRPFHVTPMMWGDMLLSPESGADAANAPNRAEAIARRSGVPKELVITDWHYAPRPHYPSVTLLKDAGFPAIATTWYSPENIESFAWSAYADGADGLLQSTWAGYHPNEATLQSEFSQFSAFVLAADYAWSPRPVPPDELPYDPAEIFKAAYDPAPMDRTVRPGFTVDLPGDILLSSDPPISASAGAPTAGIASGWLGYGPEHDLSAFPTGAVDLNGVHYQIGKAVALGGRLLPGQTLPGEMIIPVNRRIRELRFLVTSGWVGQAGVVAKAVMDDGSASDTIQFVEGKNILPWTDLSALPGAKLAWRGVTRAGDPVGIREVTWLNPHPERPVRQVIFQCLDRTATPILLGLTGVGAAGL